MEMVQILHQTMTCSNLFIDLLNDGKGFYWCNQAWPAGTETEMESLFSEMVGGQGTEIEDITEGMQDKFEDLLDE